MDSTNGHPMVEVRDLRKYYGYTRAVDGISFKVNKGEVVGFLGPNGAGKTTTLQVLTGYLKPSRGEAFIGGIPVAEDPLAAQLKLGYLPERAAMYEDMMVIDFLRYVGQLRNVAPDKLTERIKDVGGRCGLLDVLGKDIGQLSKGYRQRVGLAQALLHDPDILLLDEPTSGLDPNQIVEIRQMIRDLGRDKTVMLSTHILSEVQATCDRVIIISDGRLVADDTPDALAAQGSGAQVGIVIKGKDDGALDAGKIQTVLADLPGVRKVDDAEGEGEGTLGFKLSTTGGTDPREAIFSAAVNNDFVLLDVHRERVSLEDTFRRLTTGTES